ncbi:MAG: hypothetical protein IPJ97_03235 [Proteobacteria bacterium]|nr:hypothetical protein [Pseudomonadota bacterium]
MALDGATGQLRWGQQLVHHDLWDYDLASQPTLVNLVRGGKPVAAVIQATKMGFLFTFDRDSGVPVSPSSKSQCLRTPCRASGPRRLSPIPWRRPRSRARDQSRRMMPGDSRGSIPVPAASASSATVPRACFSRPRSRTPSCNRVTREVRTGAASHSIPGASWPSPIP